MRRQPFSVVCPVVVYGANIILLYISALLTLFCSGFGSGFSTNRGWKTRSGAAASRWRNNVMVRYQVA